MNNIIEVKNVTKKYPGFTLNHINLEVHKGTIMGLVGENGAGKTTLIKLIMNLVNCDEGTIRVFGMDHTKDERKIKEQIGVVLDDSFFSEYLKTTDISKIMNKFYQSWDHKLFLQYLKDFQIPSNKMIKELSRGMKMKLQIATALSHHPRLLILDEPTSGLDPVVRNEILDIFLDFIQDEEKGILLSTHITSDLEHIADYITFIHRGNLILTESRDELLDQYGILRCDEKTFKKLEQSDIVRYRKNHYDYEILVSDRKICKKKYPNAVIDKASIEEIMVLMIKGETK